MFGCVFRSIGAVGADLGDSRAVIRRDSEGDPFSEAAVAFAKATVPKDGVPVLLGDHDDSMRDR